MRRYEGVFAEFRKEYPEIRVVTITGRGSDLGNRIVAERRAGKYLVDIYVGGPYTVASSLMPAKAVDPISDVLFLPEVVDESKWITGKHRYTDLALRIKVSIITPAEWTFRKMMLIRTINWLRARNTGTRTKLSGPT